MCVFIADTTRLTPEVPAVSGGIVMSVSKQPNPAPKPKGKPVTRAKHRPAEDKHQPKPKPQFIITDYASI
jgi:hypothetical protein